MLLLFELDFRCGTHLDDSHTTGQLGESLLELLTVVVRVGILDLRLDLVDATLDFLFGTRAFDNRRLVLGDDDLARRTECFETCVF